MSVQMTATQWGVGQGGFHTQTIAYSAYRRTHALRVIYDCGTSKGGKHLRKSIEAYAASLSPGDIIDVLYISHWDSDHCGGINQLGKALKRRSVRVAQVVAPPLSELHAIRLLAYSEGSAAWKHLIADPRKAVEEFFGEECAYQTMEPDSLGNDTSIEPLAGAPIRPTHNGMGRAIFGARGSLLWEVIPYLHPDALSHWEGEGAQSSGWSIANGVLHIPRGERSRLRTESGGGFLDDAVNASSIMLYSGAAKEKRGAWLGTGDANLSDHPQRDADLRRFVAFYTPERLQRVAVVNAPHHGSKHSSGKWFWHQFSNTVAVFNASGSSYRDENGIAHPHAEVLAAVRRGGHTSLTTAKHENSLTITNTIP